MLWTRTETVDGTIKRGDDFWEIQHVESTGDTEIALGRNEYEEVGVLHLNSEEATALANAILGAVEKANKMNNTKRAHDLLSQAIDATNLYNEVGLRSYSGRYMYNRKCIGLDGDATNILKVLFKAVMLDSDTFEDCELDNFLTDSMGLGMIYYWAHLDETEGLEFDGD